MTLQSEDMGKLVAGPDGWIEWSGGENPMPGQAVEVMFRDLYEVNAEDRARATRHSSNVSWKHWGTSSDIIAFRPAHREAQPETDGGGEAWTALTPDEQFSLATRIAANIGYELTPDPEHPDSPHTTPEGQTEGAPDGADWKTRAGEFADVAMRNGRALVEAEQKAERAVWLANELAQMLRAHEFMTEPLESDDDVNRTSWEAEVAALASKGV